LPALRFARNPFREAIDEDRVIRQMLLMRRMRPIRPPQHSLRANLHEFRHERTCVFIQGWTGFRTKVRRGQLDPSSSGPDRSLHDGECDLARRACLGPQQLDHDGRADSSKKGEADALARKWIGDHPNDIAFQSYLAEQALRNRDLKLAAAQYQAVLAKQPDNVTALNNLAWALGQQGDPKAMSYAERALKLAPESPLVLDTVGVLYTSGGDAAKGAQYLARAVALAPERHDIRLNYAKALLKAGRTDDARKELEQLQKVSQDFPGKAEVADLLKQQ